MITVKRACFSPACRGEKRKQTIKCNEHPDTVDCSGTCRKRLLYRDSICTFCGETNPSRPPKKPAFSFARVERGKETRKNKPRARGRTRVKKGKRGNRKFPRKR